MTRLTALMIVGIIGTAIYGTYIFARHANTNKAVETAVGLIFATCIIGAIGTYMLGDASVKAFITFNNKVKEQTDTQASEIVSKAQKASNSVSITSNVSDLLGTFDISAIN